MGRSRIRLLALGVAGLVVLAGEITTTGFVNFSDVARQTIREIGYNDPGLGFDAMSCAVLSAVDLASVSRTTISLAATLRK